jgi:hypothetical protein
MKDPRFEMERKHASELKLKRSPTPEKRDYEQDQEKDKKHLSNPACCACHTTEAQRPGNDGNDQEHESIT